MNGQTSPRQTRVPEFQNAGFRRGPRIAGTQPARPANATPPRRDPQRLTPCVLVCALWALATTAQAKTVYVNLDGKGDFTSIRAAVAAAQSGDTIVLEQGTYSDRDNFDIVYTGKDLTFRSRDPNNPAIVAKTIIDCRGGGEDTHYALSARSDGGEARMSLAGLTIRNGYDVALGGAVRCEEADLEAINCNFENSQVQGSGGAVYCRNDRARFMGCTFSKNAADTMYGGAVYSTGSQLEFVNCTFRDNTGCAVETWDCQVTLTGCTFQNNKGQDGGALHCRADVSPETTSLTVTRCTFTGNAANGKGGGAIFNFSAPATISACTFKANKASTDGGAIYNYGASPTIASCLFAGNTATGTGGAVNTLWTGSNPNLLNCTFVGNSAASGGAVAAKGGSNPLLSHCILWGNTATAGASVYLGAYPWSSVRTATATVEFCDVQDGRGSAATEPDCKLTWDADSNINRDPLFVAPADGDYHLAPDSACINTGDPAYTPKPGQTDLDGGPRLMGSAIDLGAYEFGGLGPVYRFWSKTKTRHFYTISSAERDALLNQSPNDWELEMVAFYAYYVPVTANLKPVYRFVSKEFDSHFYTISEDERQRVLRNWPDAWSYEFVAFYAYPEGEQPKGALPVYRFWSGYVGAHFYTIDEDEKNRVLREYPTFWEYEGVAWYAYAKP